MLGMIVANLGSGGVRSAITTAGTSAKGIAIRMVHISNLASASTGLLHTMKPAKTIMATTRRRITFGDVLVRRCGRSPQLRQRQPL